MSYSSAHETTDLRSYAFKGGARGSGGRVALLRCLRPPSLPDPSRQCPPRASASDSRKSRVRLPDGQKRHPCLQREGPWRPPSGLLASKRSPRRLRRERVGGSTRDAPPRPQKVRQTKQPVDLTDGRRGQLRGGHNTEAGQWRDHPSNARKAWRALGAGQALDREPRSPIRPKKGARDRLIRLAQRAILGGLWASRTRPGSPASSDLLFIRGRMPLSLLCDFLRKKRERTIPSRRPSPATGSTCRRWHRPG